MTVTTPAARQAAVRCQMVREGVNNRRIPCNRPAAKKYDYRYCGNCAADLKCRQLNDGRRTHKPNCLGCGLDCCTDRSKCVPGRCQVFVNRRFVPVTAKDVATALASDNRDMRLPSRPAEVAPYALPLAVA